MTHAVVERETMLFDDQVRRMVEARQKMHWYSSWCGVPTVAPIRAEAWTPAAWERRSKVSTAARSVWQRSVGDEIDVWRTAIEYDPKKHLPDPEGLIVGEHAVTDEDYDNAACACLFMGVDGTTHGRCGRVPSLLCSLKMNLFCFAVCLH